MKTYYEILGVSEKATHKEIKSAYKVLMKKYHPDVYKGNNNEIELLIKINHINPTHRTIIRPQPIKTIVPIEENLHKIFIIEY